MGLALYSLGTRSGVEDLRRILAWTRGRGRRPRFWRMETGRGIRNQVWVFQGIQLLFDAAVRAVGLPSTFKPYSLRRGGASCFFQATGNYHRTMELGNWKHLSTAKIYINTALLELTQSQILNTPHITAAADAFLQLFS